MKCFFESKRNIPKSFSILFDDKFISISPKVKSLGIWLDSNLTFSDHKLCSKLNGTLICLNKIKHNLDYKSRILIIHALIFSHINYCQTIWGKSSQENLNSIQKCINFAAKVTSKGKYKKSDHVTNLLKDLQWLNINNRQILREAVCIYKNINQYSNAHCLQIHTRQQQASLNTKHMRNENNIHIEFRKTKIGKSAVSITGSKIWNNLSKDIQSSNSPTNFSKKLANQLLQKEFD